MDSRHFSGSTWKGSRRDCSPLRWPDLNSLFERAQLHRPSTDDILSVIIAARLEATMAGWLALPSRSPYFN